MLRSRRCGCLVTWFCYQLIAKPGNKSAAPPWPDSDHDHDHDYVRCFRYDTRIGQEQTRSKNTWQIYWFIYLGESHCHSCTRYPPWTMLLGDTCKFAVWLIMTAPVIFDTLYRQSITYVHYADITLRCRSNIFHYTRFVQRAFFVFLFCFVLFCFVSFYWCDLSTNFMRNAIRTWMLELLK